MKYITSLNTNGQSTKEPYNVLQNIVNFTNGQITKRTNIIKTLFISQETNDLKLLVKFPAGI